MTDLHDLYTVTCEELPHDLDYERNTQMKATHTPAPWKLACESYNDHEAFVIEAEGRTICWTASSLDEEGSETITEEDTANARLIAAAPQMLEALRAALEAMGDTYDVRDAEGSEGEQLRDQIAEAIADATGEQVT